MYTALCRCQGGAVHACGHWDMTLVDTFVRERPTCDAVWFGNCMVNKCLI